MTVHTATDAFAHNYYVMLNDGTIIHLNHDSNGLADVKEIDVKKYPNVPETVNNRFTSAGRTAYRIAKRCANDQTGDVKDFSSYGHSDWDGYCLYSILDYALEADEKWGKSVIEKEFTHVNCKRVRVPLN